MTRPHYPIESTIITTDNNMRYYNLKNEENGVSIWVDVQLTNMNYHFVEWSIGRIQMDRPHFLLAVKKTGSSIKAFMPFDWPFCELFEIDNNFYVFNSLL